MTTKVDLAIEGRLGAYVRADAKAMAKIHTMAVRKAGGRTKTGIQKEIRSAFAGNGRGQANLFAAAIKLKSDPARGFARDTTVRVYSKARYRAKGRRAADIDLLEVYNRSATVHAANRAWLAVPTENAPMRGGRGGGNTAATPKESGLDLVFLHTADPNKAVLVTKARGGGRPVVMYVLLKQTFRYKRLDPDEIHAASVAAMPADIAAMWTKEEATIRADFGRGLDTGENR